MFFIPIQPRIWYFFVSLVRRLENIPICLFIYLFIIKGIPGIRGNPGLPGSPGAEVTTNVTNIICILNFGETLNLTFFYIYQGPRGPSGYKGEPGRPGVLVGRF